ncbi:Alpha/Beta hydrolase protein, partial [Mycena polygramma]
LRSYTRYSSTAYHPRCSGPLGKTLIRSFERGRTKGLIARDDDRQEIVVSFRGTFSLSTAITNAQFLLSPFLTPGLNVSESVDILVHRGFRDAYDNVANDVLAIVMVQLALFPEFRVVVTGHSLGGAIASFGAPHFRPLRLRSTHSVRPSSISSSLTLNELYLGQPRIGNAEFASWVEKTLGEENIYRTVYTFDGVPTMVPRFLNYTHFATEYWQFRDPVPFITTRESTVKQCVRGEDPTCSVRIRTSRLSAGVSLIHFGLYCSLHWD